MDSKLDKIRKSRSSKLKRKSFRKALLKNLLIYGILSILVSSIYLSINYFANSSHKNKLVYPDQPLSKDKFGYLVESPQVNQPVTILVYEDFRCPICKTFEEAYGSDINTLIQAGKLKVTYYIGSFLDANLGGSGSLIAANSAACAQNLHVFKPYHDLLYQHQPSELEDNFSDKNYLIAIGNQIPQIKDNLPYFKKCLNEKKYTNWVKKVQDLFVERKIDGTPTFIINGKKINLLKHMQDRDKVLQILTTGHE